MISYEEAVALQKKLAKEIRVVQNSTIGRASLFGGADVAYVPKKGKAIAAVVAWNLKERQIVAAASAVLNISFPYIPGLLSFRELPVLLEAWKELKDRPEVWLVDGAGIAHPRRLGLASHFALATEEKCVVGVAKSPRRYPPSGAVHQGFLGAVSLRRRGGRDGAQEFKRRTPAICEPRQRTFHYPGGFSRPPCLYSLPLA